MLPKNTLHITVIIGTETILYRQVGLYKVEFRILEIRISGETNLKKHFLSGNWIRKKFFWAEKTFEFWISAENSLWILAKTFFFFFFGDHLILAGKNCIVTVCHELF